MNTNKTLDELLEDIQVEQLERLEGKARNVEDWYAVSTGEEGIIAFFVNETDAFRFRLDLINRKLNP